MTSTRAGTRRPADLFTRIDAALERNDIPGAIALAEEGMQAGQETPLLLNLVAFGREQVGELHAALPLLERAVALGPQDPPAWNALGGVLSKLGRSADALPAFERAIALAPSYSPHWVGLGLALEVLGRETEADDAYRNAIAVDPANPDAPGALAAMRVRRREEGAEGPALQALALNPVQPSATLALATLDQRSGKYGAVEQRITALLVAGGLAPLHEASAHRLLADAIHAQGGRPQAALASYDLANRLLRTVHAPVYAADGVEDGVALCDRLTAWFTNMTAWTVAPGDATSPAREHVFLVGFPRSGTTLLEQVLASHPDVEALEERPTLGDIGPRFANDAALTQLQTLKAAEAGRLRADYWSRVSQFGADPRGKVFIDKQPLDTLWLPYIAKLFPNAKVLFARRDPRDVVLSCYRRRFAINDVTYHFTDLAEVARFYAAVMTLADVYREVLSLSWRVHRHEDLVEGFDAETRGLCDFLGLDWNESMRDFAATARRRDVRTPSVDQVRRGLYREGMAQWRPYVEGMASAMPILAPWVERFGYPAS